MSRLRRALHVVLVLKTARGGLWTLPQVEELRQRGHRVTAVLPGGGGRLADQLGRRGVEVVESPFSFSFAPRPTTLAGLWRLRRELRRLRPDVVHYHLYASALAGRLATLAMPVARVHMVAGPLYLESATIRRVERLLCRLDDVVIGGSEHTSERYRALGRSTESTPSIAYGVDTATFQPFTATQRAKARAELGLQPDDFVVVMVSYVYAPKRSVHRGRGIKGHDVVLEAWQPFARRHPTARLLLLGGGFDEPGEAYRRYLVNRYRLREETSVSWLPSVDDVQSCYAAADVSVSPSLSENHGAALEAGAMAVPSIVSDAGALPETVDPECGWVVPRGDPAALTRALEAAHREFEAGDLGARGLRARERTVRLFDSRATAARVADAIEGAAVGLSAR